MRMFCTQSQGTLEVHKSPLEVPRIQLKMHQILSCLGYHRGREKISFNLYLSSMTQLVQRSVDVQNSGYLHTFVPTSVPWKNFLSKKVLYDIIDCWIWQQQHVLKLMYTANMRSEITVKTQLKNVKQQQSNVKNTIKNCKIYYSYSTVLCTFLSCVPYLQCI